MKTNCWLILGTMLATTAVAQVNTNALPEIPAPATTAPAIMPAPVDVKTNAPAKKTVKAKKKGVKKKAIAQHTAKTEAKATENKAAALPAGPITLVPGPATVAADNVNLRGQAGLKGEVVGLLKKGDVVTVLAEITVDKPKAGEPPQWAKIALPAGSKVWLDAKFVDATNNVVLAKKLNLRGGPGENYSVLGVIEKGASVTPIITKGNWMQIQPPASAFAFLAASYLKQEAGTETKVPAAPAVTAAETVPPPAAPVTEPVVLPTPTTVAEAPAIAPPAATPPPATVITAPVTQSAAPEAAPATAPSVPVTPVAILPQPTLAPEETDTNLPPPPRRVVTHEGTVRPSVSVVAPTYYELYDPSSDLAINYLYPPSTNLNLSLYNGKHITVTGEEGMDVRWKDTPVLTIKKIAVVPEENAPRTQPVMKPVKTRK